MRWRFASIRYAWALMFSTQRWVAPAVVLVGLIAWIWSTPPLGADTVRISLLVLFALAAWLGHAVGTMEDAGQELISTSALGSRARLLLGKWTVSVGLATAFPLLLIAGTYAWGLGRMAEGAAPLLGGPTALASALAVLAVAACAAAAGLLMASLLPARPGWGVMVLLLAALCQAVPGWAPVPILANAIPGVRQPIGLDFGVALAIAVALTAALVAAAIAARRPGG